MEHPVHIKIFLILIFCIFLTTTIDAEETIDHAVLISIAASDSIKPVITVNWASDTDAVSYNIYRKLKDESQWTLLATYSPDITFYTDTAIVKNVGYEYYVRKETANYNGFGYVYAGFELPFDEYRGKLLLLVDRTVADSLSSELEQFVDDLEGDGWFVIKYEVPRTENFNPQAVSKIKQLINAEYYKAGGDLKSLILFGRVAVPYSAAYAFDGHSPNHFGAWAADVYYSIMSGSWTDFLATTPDAARKVTINYPLDGKFDQTTSPGPSTLDMGRIDFFDLPKIKQSEIELLRNYLRKDHEYRHGNTNVVNRALIDDGFKMYSFEAFASMAWMNFAALVGPKNIDTGGYVPNLLDKNYIWSYGCNQGDYTGMLSTIYTDQFASLPVQGIFTTYLGSYLGDWDSQDNLMRAAIASKSSILECFWGGRPFWHFHKMALGETIGMQAKLAQNNSTIYQSSGVMGYQGVHIALMGDPSIRMHVIPSPLNFRVISKTENENNTETLKLGWNGRDSSANRYILFSFNPSTKRYERLINDLIADSSVTITIPDNTEDNLMLRAFKLQETPTGTFYNESQGVYLNGHVSKILSVNESFSDYNVNITPNPAKNNFWINFELTKPSKVSASIYNVNGEKLTVLLDEYLPSGNSKFDIKLNSSNLIKLNPGFYLIIFNINENTEIKKLILQ